MRFYVKLVVFLLVLNLIFLIIPSADAQGITSEGVTTVIEGPVGEFSFKSIKKFYEISPSSLEKGHSITLDEKDAFRIKIWEKNYYLIVWNISDDKVLIIAPGERQLILTSKQTASIDLNQNKELDVILTLTAIEDKKAKFYIKEFVEEKLVVTGDYFELFDVTLSLTNYVIYNTANLNAFVVFENFGEGPSEIEIVYSIINETGEEVYTGVDSKIVQTEDSVVKNFGFLNLPAGKYKISANIFYGDNQTGDSEKSFEIKERSLSSLLTIPLIFIFSLLGILIMLSFARKYSKNENGKRKNRTNY